MNTKNGWRLFNNFNTWVTSPFGYRINPITGKGEGHNGVDYSTNGQYIPCLAIDDGVVIRNGTDGYGGNFTYVKYPRLDKIAIYYHLSEFRCSANQSVKKGDIIGITGNTGQSTGPHLHFGTAPLSEYGKGYYEIAWEDFERYDYPEPITIPTPVNENGNVDQVKVNWENTLYVRTGAGLGNSSIGFAKPGFYNVISMKNVDNYTWYEVESGKWFANVKDCVEFIPKYTPPAEEPIEELPVEEDPPKEPETPQIPTEEEDKPNTQEEEKENSYEDNKDLNNPLLWLIDLIVELIKKLLKKIKASR